MNDLIRPTIDKFPSKDNDDLDLRRKTTMIIAKFGAELLSTPLDELRTMAAQPCGPDNENSIFCRMWNEHHFVPSGRWLRRCGGKDRSIEYALATVMDAVWPDD